MSEDGAAPGPPVGDATGLALALSELGLSCAVEAHERLAVLVPTSAMPDLSDAAVRRRLQALATRHGFTHVALDLGE